MNPHNFSLRKLNLISGESKLLTKQILLSKYWIEDGELEILENEHNQLNKATKGGKKEDALNIPNTNDDIILDDDLNAADNQFDLDMENIDLTEGMEARFDFSGQIEKDTAMPDTV